MEFCQDCFLDTNLQKIISKIGYKSRSKCQFCKQSGSYKINVEKAKELFDPILELYIPEDDCPYGFTRGYMIWDHLVSDWEIFLTCEIAEKIICTIYQDSNSVIDDILNSKVILKEEWGESEDKQKYSNVWKSFCDEIKNKNRFFPKSFEKKIIKKIIDGNTTIIEKGHELFRARINRTNQIFKNKEMGSPPSDKSSFGRMNPQGISYLYLSDDPDTTIGEVRPNIDDIVNIAKFKLKSDLKLVDIITPYIGSPFKYKEDLPKIFKARRLIEDLGNNLSKPVNKNEYLEYLPTQYFCEFIKSLGYDGLIYKSSINSKNNYLIFNERNFKCVSVSECKIQEITYKTKSISK